MASSRTAPSMGGICPTSPRILTRVGLAQDMFSAGEDIAGIMDALRWKSPRVPLVYNGNLAAVAGQFPALVHKGYP